MREFHRCSSALDPEVLAPATERVSIFRDDFIASAPADIARHDKTGIPTF
jgi:hypothetical protein